MDSNKIGTSAFIIDDVLYKDDESDPRCLATIVSLILNKTFMPFDNMTTFCVNM